LFLYRENWVGIFVCAAYCSEGLFNALHKKFLNLHILNNPLKPGPDYH